MRDQTVCSNSQRRLFGRKVSDIRKSLAQAKTRSSCQESEDFSHGSKWMGQKAARMAQETTGTRGKELVSIASCSDYWIWRHVFRIGLYTVNGVQATAK